MSHLFISYTHRSKEDIDPILANLREAGLRLWRDVDQLHAGDNWMAALEIALLSANGLLAFIAKDSLRSPIMLSDLNTAAQRGLPIIGILIEHLPKLPDNLPLNRIVDLSDPQTYDERFRELVGLAQVLQEQPPLPETELKLQGERAENLTSQAPPVTLTDTVFLVHGHDMAFVAEVRDYLATLGIDGIVLNDEISQHGYLFEKFWQHQARAEFAIVLISSDDLGSAKREYHEVYEGEKVKDKALKFRARQNVILELGFFYGRLGTDRVLVLQKLADTFYPPFERPSDLDGRLFNELDAGGKWKEVLRQKLREQGFPV